MQRAVAESAYFARVSTVGKARHGFMRVRVRIGGADGYGGPHV